MATWSHGRACDKPKCSARFLGHDYMNKKRTSLSFKLFKYILVCKIDLLGLWTHVNTFDPPRRQIM